MSDVAQTFCTMTDHDRTRQSRRAQAARSANAVSAASVRVLGSGIVAIQALFRTPGLLGSGPKPTIVRPSADIALARANVQPVSPVAPPAMSTSRKFCIPPPAVQMNASLPDAVVPLPTMMEPSALMS
jgi:hypothetical protein